MKGGRRPRTFLDAEERAIILADKRGEFVPAKNQKQAIAEVQAIARRTLARKAARINIRLAPADLDLLKARAKVEGLPYQTLIASILHKYVTLPAAVVEPPKKRRSA
jgi:predicted DNA binding CopG/RHH family protein